MPLRRWYTAKWHGRDAFVKVVPRGTGAKREVATLTKLQALPQCRVVCLLHAAHVMLVEPRTQKAAMPHAAIVTAVAPRPVFVGRSASDRLRTALELVEVRVYVCCVCACAMHWVH